MKKIEILEKATENGTSYKDINVNSTFGVLQTKVNSRNKKSPAKFARQKKSITKQAGEELHRQPR